ncbi:hypothetical protein SFRURICE_005235 [Spodoptera frugiperda]|nr:hypothetical protein SFRURICE_005235 [Spodoptera frugiperda]
MCHGLSIANVLGIEGTVTFLTPPSSFKGAESARVEGERENPIEGAREPQRRAKSRHSRVASRSRGRSANRKARGPLRTPPKVKIKARRPIKTRPVRTVRRVRRVLCAPQRARPLQMGPNRADARSGAANNVKDYRGPGSNQNGFMIEWCRTGEE